MPIQEREAKRAKLKSENAHAYIQEDTSANSSGQAKHITAVSSISQGACATSLFACHLSAKLLPDDHVPAQGTSGFR